MFSLSASFMVARKTHTTVIIGNRRFYLSFDSCEEKDMVASTKAIDNGSQDQLPPDNKFNHFGGIAENNL